MFVDLKSLPEKNRKAFNEIKRRVAGELGAYNSAIFSHEESQEITNGTTYTFADVVETFFDNLSIKRIDDISQGVRFRGF